MRCKKLSDVIKEDFVQEAQDKEFGVILRSTRLATDIKNMSQQQIKEDKKYIDQYFSRLDRIQKLGGYLNCCCRKHKARNTTLVYS